MNYLSKILSIDYAKDDIIVQSLTPNIIETKMARPFLVDPFLNLISVSAKSFVHSALEGLGRGEVNSHGHLKHRIINWAILAFISLTDRFGLNDIWQLYYAKEMRKECLQSANKSEKNQEEKI